MSTRVAIFIDGANMFYAQKSNNWHIDYAKVLSFFTRDKERANAYYFTATPPATSISACSKYKKFKAALIHIGYTVIDKEVRVVKDNKTGLVKVKGNLDIELVFRMLSTTNHYDEAILMGGDSDYIPIIKHLANIGKRIICVGARHMTSTDLINVADKFVELNEIRGIIEK